jgi:asparagine synthase (glutamine-hydrolysing)
MLPTYYVSKLAREHVTVVLTGDGGDEIFGGYARYERELSIERMPGFLRLLLSCAGKLLPDGMRGKRRFSNMSHELATRYVQTDMPFLADSRSSMYLREFFAQVRDHDPYQRAIGEFHNAQHLDIMTQMQFVDVRLYLADDILIKVDKASMLNSLEVRAPMLDQHLVEYVSSLSSTVRMRNGMLKYLLKQVAVDLLPTEILARPKQGFGVPFKHWFRSDLTDYTHDLLGSPRAQQRGIFDSQFVRNLLKTHASTKLINHSNAIWALLCLELWLQTYMDQPSYVEHSATIRARTEIQGTSTYIDNTSSPAER